MLLGAAAQFGIFGTFIGAYALGFPVNEAAAISIIGGADGPTAIFSASMLAPTCWVVSRSQHTHIWHWFL